MFLISCTGSWTDPGLDPKLDPGQVNESGLDSWLNLWLNFWLHLEHYSGMETRLDKKKTWENWVKGTQDTLRELKMKSKEFQGTPRKYIELQGNVRNSTNSKEIQRYPRISEEL